MLLTVPVGNVRHVERLKFHLSPKLESGVLGKGALQLRNQPNTSEDNGVKGAKLEWEFAFRVGTVPFPACWWVRLGNLNWATQLGFTSDSGICSVVMFSALTLLTLYG